MTPYRIRVEVQGTVDSPEVKINGVAMPLHRGCDFITHGFPGGAAADVAATILAEYVPANAVPKLLLSFGSLIGDKCGKLLGMPMMPLDEKFVINLQGFLHRQGMLYKPDDPLADEREVTTASYRHANIKSGTAIFLDGIDREGYVLTLCKGLDPEDKELAYLVDPYWQAIQIAAPESVLIKLKQTLDRILPETRKPARATKPNR